MNSKETKKCPFCGSDKIAYTSCEKPFGGFYYARFCMECRVSTNYFDSKEEADEAWDRRA